MAKVIGDNRANHYLYQTWWGMINRCHNPKTHLGRSYRDKGIEVCARWRNDFWAFVSDMGNRPDGYSIDRIDSSGNYEPANCRWATITTQNRNRKNVVRIVVGDENLSISEWSERTGLPKYTIVDRIKQQARRGYSAEQVVGLQPVPVSRSGRPSKNPNAATYRP